MQIDTSVDESDIGKVKAGQKAAFTVDAYPESTFNGEVSVVRNAPINVSNVVTYNAVIIVDNTDLKLKPGMTANVSVETEIKQSVLRVPNAALRFKPATAAATPDQKAAKGSKGPGVWILENNKPKNVKIKTGISDSNYTEVISGELNEGQQIITDSSNGTKKNDPAPGAGAPRFMR